MKTGGTKIVFWVVIAVMVMGSIVSFSSFAFLPQSQNNSSQSNNRAALETINDSQKSIQGIVRSYESTNGTGYYIEVAENPMAILTTTDQNIKLENYVGKEVTVRGSASLSAEEDGVALDVSSIELVK